MERNNFFTTIFTYFNLENELDDFDRIHESIKKDIVFKGTNLWILMFAIINSFYWNAGLFKFKRNFFELITY